MCGDVTMSRGNHHNENILLLFAPGSKTPSIVAISYSFLKHTALTLVLASFIERWDTFYSASLITSVL